jgi:hypothetical protein
MTRRRWFAMFVAFGLLAAACASDAPEAADPSSSTAATPPTTPSSTTAGTATPPSTTTTTEAPEPLLDCPRPAEPLATADMDGDGIDEALTIETVDGGQLFVACGRDGGRSLDLGLGVWYLAVFDVEPDGVDEVFLGGSRSSFRRDRPPTLHRVDPSGNRLEQFNENRSGISGGVGCVDVDGDGVRELVRTWIDDDASTSEEVVWDREVVVSRPADDEPDPTRGVFRVGPDDDQIALLTRLSCGEIIEPIRVQPPAAMCAEAGRTILADVDADGLDDRVHQRQTNSLAVFEGHENGGPAIAVCTAAGGNDEVKVGGMGEIFAVSVDTGDRPTIWSGGTTAASASYDPMVWVDGRIVPITDDDGPIYFESGWFGNDRRMAFGCVDLDGNGIVELVQFDGVRDGAEMVWTRRSWETVADQAELITETGGRLPWPEWPKGEFTGELPVAFDDLAVSDVACGWVQEVA